MSTPEGEVKKQVKAVLARFDFAPAGKEMEMLCAPGWYYMPVSNGMGVGGIHDFIGCFHGLFFSIETKDKGKKMTERQLQRKYGIMAAGGKVFLIDGDTTELETWLTTIKEKAGQKRQEYIHYQIVREADTATILALRAECGGIGHRMTKNTSCTSPRQYCTFCGAG